MDNKRCNGNDVLPLAWNYSGWFRPILEFVLLIKHIYILISSNIKKIDSTSLEIKVKYRPERKRFVRFKKYSIETYFFLPIETGVNKRNYTRIDFYRELKGYLKIDPPKLLLSQIAEQSHEFMSLLKQAFSDYDSKNADKSKLLEDRIKIYLNILKKAIKREVRKVLLYPSDIEKQRVANRLIKDLGTIISHYRKLPNRFYYLEDSKNKIHKTYKSGDEYISNLKYRYLLQLLNETIVEDKNTQQQIFSLFEQSLNNEIEYRILKKYPLSSSNEKKNQELIRRWDRVKHFVADKLIINTRVDRESRYLEELLYSISAGIAMVFATAIAFYYNKVFGNFTIRFFFVLVVSYMFKDRIKEWFRSFFSTILHKQVLDHRFNLYDDNKKKIGSSLDGFSFVPRRNLNEEILNIRDALNDEVVLYTNNIEKVMKFTRRNKIKARSFLKTFKEIKLRGVNDIIRFNFSPIILRLEDTRTPIYVHKKGKVKIVYTEKQIPIHIITAVKFDDDIKYQHYKVSINKHGIQQLNTVNPRSN